MLKNYLNDIRKRSNQEKLLGAVVGLIGLGIIKSGCRHEGSYKVLKDIEDDYEDMKKFKYMSAFDKED